MALKIKKLAIDPGHGRGNRSAGTYDPGASGHGYEEASIVLQWGLLARQILPRYGIEVWMTRDDAQDHAPLATRDDRANAAGADAFLSLHCNAAGSSASGVETFVRDADDRAWASILHPIAVQVIGLKDRKIKNEKESAAGRLAVLGFQGPAALLELGFISNRNDVRRMADMTVASEFWHALGRALTGLDKPEEPKLEEKVKPLLLNGHEIVDYRVERGQTWVNLGAAFKKNPGWVKDFADGQPSFTIPLKD